MFSPEVIWDAVKRIPSEDKLIVSTLAICDRMELESRVFQFEVISQESMKEDIIAIHLMLHLMNYNFLAAKNYAKKWPKELKDKALFSWVWKLCKAVGQKQYVQIPEIVAKISNNEKHKPVANAIISWHNKRMWNYIENGFESVSMETLQKLGFVGVLADEIKTRGYIVKEGYVYPTRQEKEKPAFNPKAELDSITTTMKALESV